MKKILRIFAFCVAFMSSGELVHAQVFVKTDAVKSVWSDYDFNEQGTTLESVIVFCMNKSGATLSGCRENVKQIVANHNQIIEHDKSVHVPSLNKKSNSSETKISQIIIKRDLDGGKRVSGNCDNEIVVKSGTPIKLDCDAVKNEKHLTGYVDNYGHKQSKDWRFGFKDPISQAAYNSELYPKSLKAIYGESETQKSDGSKKNTGQGNAQSADDLRQKRLGNRKDKIKHLRRNSGAEFTDAELNLYEVAKGYADVKARAYMALVQYSDASGNLKKGDRTKLRMYDCDVNANRCGFTFVGEKSGVNVLACCRVMGSNSATCEIPYTWKKGDTEHTSVSDCRG